MATTKFGTIKSDADIDLSGGGGGGGLPPGGATNQVLAKASATDGDVKWFDPNNPGLVLSPSPTMYETQPRSSNAFLPSGSNLIVDGKRLLGMCFTAPKSGTLNDIRFWMGSNTPISSTSGLKFALYEADANDNLTLLNSMQHASTAFAINIEVTGTLPGGVPLVAGHRYCMMILNNAGSGFNANGGLLGTYAPSVLAAQKPRLSVQSAASTYTDFPATLTPAQMIGPNPGNSNLIWLVMYGYGT